MIPQEITSCLFSHIEDCEHTVLDEEVHTVLDEEVNTVHDNKEQRQEHEVQHQDNVENIKNAA